MSFKCTKPDFLCEELINTSESYIIQFMSGDLAPRDIPQQEVTTGFYVGPDGEATGEIDHLKQIGLEFVHLSSSEPEAEIDVRKIAGEELQVLLLDFGIPPRIVTISGDFRSEREAGSEEYNETEDSSPNTLTVKAPTTDGSNDTYNLTYGRYLDRDVDLRRGGWLAIGHDGDSSDTRNGFLGNFDGLAVYELSEPEEEFPYRGYELLLSVGYNSHNLTLRTSGQANALVIYSRSIGFADRHAQAVTDPEELAQLLERLSLEEPQQVLRELFSNFVTLSEERESAVTSMETMEALLAHNKDLLRTERHKVWGLERKLRDAERSGSAKGTQTDDDWLSNMLGGNRQRTGRGSPSLQEACETLGIDSKILRSNNPTLIANMAKMARRAWAKTIHTDVTGESGGEQEQVLKAMNAAADVIEDAFNETNS